MSKINRKCYCKCDFQVFDWLKFTLTADLRLATFCEIDQNILPYILFRYSIEYTNVCLTL